MGLSKQEAYSTDDFTGTPETSRERGHRPVRACPAGTQRKTPHSIRYTATYKADQPGKYLILAAAVGNDHYNVMVDGKKVLDQTQVEGQHPESTTMDLTAGRNHPRDRRVHAYGRRRSLQPRSCQCSRT